MQLFYVVALQPMNYISMKNDITNTWKFMNTKKTNKVLLPYPISVYWFIPSIDRHFGRQYHSLWDSIIDSAIKRGARH